MSRCILLVVEGPKAERRFIKKVLSAYGIADEHNIFCVNTNVHVLYDRMFKDKEEDDLDLIMSLKEYASGEEREILSQRYTDIYLIFDVEIQDSKWDSEHMQKMVNFFDDPTQNGLLLLNYPMFESLRHMSSPGDRNYLESTVTAEQTHRYKELVGIEGCLELRDPNKYDKAVINMLLMMNVWKLCTILKGPSDAPDYRIYGATSLKQLFDRQCSLLNNLNRIYIINTSVMIILEFLSPDIF